jgi:AcrR family transcriptional regulator
MSTGDSRKKGGASRERTSRARADRKVERTEHKITQARRKIEDAGRKVERELERAQRHIDRAERDVERASGPIWARPEPGTRRARFTREQIAEAALAISDSEGFEAVSMRRVAAELGAGTMTLYHYVRTKDELVALMDNAIMGELLIPDDELPSDWREALTLIARRTRDALVRHPWTLEAMGAAQIGPNGLRHMEQSVAAVAELDLDDVARFEVINLIDEYVFGHVIRGRRPTRDDPEAMEEWLERATRYIEEQVQTGDYPHLQAIMPEGGMSEFWKRFEEADVEDSRFERGLARLLDGIALELERRRKPA